MSGTSGSNVLSPEKRALAVVNLLLQSDYKSLKELRNGAVWCRLLDRILPGSVRLDLVSSNSSNLTDWHANYHLLHSALKRLHIPMMLYIYKIIDGDANQIIRVVYAFIELYVRKKEQGSQSLFGKKSDNLLPQIGGSSCILPKLKNFLAVFHDEEVNQQQIEQIEQNYEKKVTIADIEELDQKQPEKRASLLHRAGFWSATSRRSFLPNRLFTKTGKRMEAGHQEGEPLQLRVQHFLGQQHSQIMTSETPTNRSDSNRRDNRQVPEAQQQERQQIIIQKKIPIDKLPQQQLIQECSQLERSELFMERLWLQCRERRKDAHNKNKTTNKNNKK